MSLPEDTRATLPPINVLKDERNNQNKIVDIHQITEVKGFLFSLHFMTSDESFCESMSNKSKSQF